MATVGDIVDEFTRTSRTVSSEAGALHLIGAVRDMEAARGVDLRTAWRDTLRNIAYIYGHPAVEVAKFPEAERNAISIASTALRLEV